MKITIESSDVKEINRMNNSLPMAMFIFDLENTIIPKHQKYKEYSKETRKAISRLKDDIVKEINARGLVSENLLD
jgi:hypothetical protein